MMLQLKYQGLVVSEKKIFSCFPCISQCKTCDTQGGPIFGNGHNLNKLGRGPQDDATYHISRLYLVVSDKILSCFSCNISQCKT